MINATLLSKDPNGAEMTFDKFIVGFTVKEEDGPMYSCGWGTGDGRDHYECDTDRTFIIDYLVDHNDEDLRKEFSECDVIELIAQNYDY